MSRIKLYLFCIFNEQKNGRHEIKDVQTGYIYIFMLTTPVLNIYDLNFVQPLVAYVQILVSCYRWQKDAFADVRSMGNVWAMLFVQNIHKI